MYDVPWSDESIRHRLATFRDTSIGMTPFNFNLALKKSGGFASAVEK